jgi:hypothetical protein
MQLAQEELRVLRCTLFSACMLWALSGTAQAGGSLLVDDAAVTPAGHCQLESWVRAYSHGQELTAVPACNRAGTEYSLGVSEFLSPRSGPLATLGAKHLWREVGQDKFGVGATLSATWNASDQHADLWSVNVPASIALNDQQRRLVHVNLGWLDSGTSGRGLTAGLGVELPLNARSLLLAEIFAEPDHFRVGELGWRHVLTDAASVDFLIGHQGGLANSSWFTAIGINILFP